MRLLIEPAVRQCLLEFLFTFVGDLSGELEVFGHDFDLLLYEITKVEIFYECPNEANISNKILYADFTSKTDVDTDGGSGGGGHEH